ncbi:MAG: hypothetical protein Kow0077_13610 [Anaerolineae bacterium]
MLATQSRSLPLARPRGFRALLRHLWMILLQVQVSQRRYRALRDRAAYGVAQPLSAPASAGNLLTVDAGRRFPIAPERAGMFYRAADEHF